MFLLTRFAFLSAFPISNDESLYVNYSQLIGADWDKWKFISMRNANFDWKPPLPFWLAAPFTGLLSDPLLGGRLVSSFVSITGFLSVYCLGGFLGGRKAALWAGLLWALNPMTVFYDRLFLAETFVYSFSAAALLFTWLASERSRLFIVPAVYFGAAALLSKQSAQLALMSFFFLVLLPAEKGERLRRGGVALAAALASFAVYRLVIPAEYFADYSRFTGRWTLSLAEISAFPLANWAANAGMVLKLYTHYYSLLPLALLAAALLYWKRPGVVMLAAMFAFNSAAIIFGLRGFNEYMYHTAAAFPLTLLMALGCVAMMETDIKKGVFVKLAARAVPFAAAAFWVIQSFFYYAGPAQYMSRFATPWMRENFMDGWAGGFWIREAVERLAKTDVDTVYLDPQPGNPRTAFFVYNKKLPSTALVPMGPDFFMGLEAMKEEKSAAVFKQRGRQWEEKLLAHALCSDKVIYRVDERQTPLIVCLGYASTEKTDKRER